MLKHWPYLFCFCERHSDCWEDALLGSSANVAKMKLASNNISSILKAIGLKTGKVRASIIHVFWGTLGKLENDTSGVKRDSKSQSPICLFTK